MKKVLLSLMALCLLLPALAQEVEWGQKRITVNVEDGIKPLTSVGGYDLYYYAYGLTTNNTVFTQNFSFAVTCYIGNISGTDIESCYFRVGLTDKDGSLKEWISTEDLNTGIQSFYAEEVRSTCIITTEDLVVGDRIYLYAQIGATEEDGWVKIDGYYGDDAVPTYIEIAEVGDPIYKWNVMLVDDGLTTNVSEYYTGMSFTTTIEPANFSNTVVDKCYFKIGLTDSDGNLVEWLSNELSYSSFQINTVLLMSLSCTITSDLQAGYRIRAFYQPNDDSEDGWIWMEPYDTENGEIVLSENMILDKLYDSVSGLFYNILNETTEVEVTCEKEDGESIPYTQGEVTIPASVSTAETTYTVVGIGYQAFNGCTNLTSVDLGSVTYIGEQAFSNCTSLSDIELLESLTEIGDYAFSGCSALTGELTIPNKVTSIGDWAFSGCDKLTSLTLGSSLTTIGGSAFNSCDGLTVVTSLNTTPPTCGEDVFGSVETSAIPLYVPLGCSSVYLADKTWGEFNVMEIVNVGDKIYDSTSGLYYNILSDTEVEVTWGGEYDCSGTTEYTGEITIPETITYGGVTYNVTKIGDYAFSYCEITSISIPSWVTSIGGGIVSGCQSLKTIEVAEDNLNYCAVDNVLFSKDRTTLIQYPAGLESTSYDIPQGVTTIGFEAFCFNFNLTSVTFPNSVTTIGEKAFYCCNNLASIDIPDNVISIEDYAFYSCDAAKTITIGNGVISIGANGFNMCRYVETITIGSSVETIGEFAFLNAGYNLSANDKVKLSILNPVPPTLGDRAFSNIYTTMYVPAGTLAEYKRVWGEASNIPGLNAYAELGYAVLKIGTTSYATYYNEDYGINLTDTGIKAYWASEIENDEDNNNVVSLVNIGTTIPAKTAVVLQGAQTDLTEASATASSAESTYSSNMLHGQSTTGTISTESGYLYYILTTGGTDGEVGFYYGASDGGAFESAANKAWLAVPGTSPTSLSIKFKDNDTTGISSVSAGSYEGDGNIYTIQGIRVSDMSQKGVYIVNGKKVLVK